MSDQEEIRGEEEFESGDEHYEDEGEAPQLTDDEDQQEEAAPQHKPSLSNPDHGASAAAAALVEALNQGGSPAEEEEGELDAGSGSDDEDADEAPEDEPEIEDEIVTEQRRVDKEKHMEEMASIETEYAILKDKLFKQRLSRVEDSLRRLKDGRLSRYKHQQEAIQGERETRLTMANARRVFRELNHTEVKGAAQQGANADFVERSRNLKADLTERLKTEIEQADKNKQSMDVKFVPDPETAGAKMPMHRRNSNTQRAVKRSVSVDGYGQGQGYGVGSHTSPPQHPGQGSKRPRTASFVSRVPVIILELEDEDIAEDIYQMGGGEVVDENDNGANEHDYS